MIITEEQLAELEVVLADPGLWAAPWSAREFEVDCPCPNGEHCGDSHTCAEVEAREEYPRGSRGKPADEGDGQCVVQISVPGLVTFALPTARCVALLRNHADARGAEVRASRAGISAAREWLAHLETRGRTNGRYLDGVPGELMDVIDEFDRRMGGSQDGTR